MKMVKIKVVEGRVPCFPENGAPIPLDKTVDIIDSPQIRRMVKDGDIEYVKPKPKQKQGGKD